MEPDQMIRLSQVMIENHEISSFSGLLDELRKRGQEGQVLLEIDLKPDYQDTPRNWRDRVEITFTSKS